MLTCAVMQSPGIDVSPSVEEDLGYLGGADVAGPEEGGPGAGVPQLQAGSALHQEVDTVRSPLSGSVVQGRATLAVLDTSDHHVATKNRTGAGGGDCQTLLSFF